MAEFITLIGAEDVRHAGHVIRDAAVDIQNAASSMAETAARHRDWMDEALSRFERLIERFEAAATEETR